MREPAGARSARQPEPAPRSTQGIPGFKAGPGEQRSTPRPTSRGGNAPVPHGTPVRESRARSRSAAPGQGHDPPGFSATKRWKSLTTHPVLPAPTPPTTGFGRVRPLRFPPWAGLGPRRYFHHSPTVRTRRSQRRSSAHLRARSASQSDALRSRSSPRRRNESQGWSVGGSVSPCSSMMAISTRRSRIRASASSRAVRDCSASLRSVQLHG